MSSRLARHLAARCAIVAMLCGQLAVAAYACAAAQPPLPNAMLHMTADAQAAETPCADMLLRADAPRANACKVHCSDGVTSPGQPDWPPVTLAPLPGQTLALAQEPAVDGVAQERSAPLQGAPPPTLRYCRLLI